MTRIARILAATALLALLAGCGAEDDLTPLDLTGDAATGATVYQNSCATCHAADGGGDVGPSLIDEVPEHTDKQLVEVILRGTDRMQAQKLSHQETADVIAYLRSAFGEFIDPGHEH